MIIIPFILLFSTGATSGIGHNTAIHFARLGAHLMLTGTNVQSLEKVVTECRQEAGCSNLEIDSIIGDLCSEEFCQQLIDKTLSRFGRLDVLVIMRAIDVNLINLIHC